MGRPGVGGYSARKKTAGDTLKNRPKRLIWSLFIARCAVNTAKHVRFAGSGNAFMLVLANFDEIGESRQVRLTALVEIVREKAVDNFPTSRRRNGIAA